MYDRLRSKGSGEREHVHQVASKERFKNCRGSSKGVLSIAMPVMEANRQTSKNLGCDLDEHHRGRDTGNAQQKRAGLASTMNPGHLQCIAKQLRSSAQHFADDRLVNALLDAHGTSGSKRSKLSGLSKDKTSKGVRMLGTSQGSNK